MFDTGKGHGVTVNENTNPVITNPDTIRLVISTESLQIGDLLYAAVVWEFLEYQRMQG